MSTDEQLVKEIINGQTERYREIVSRYENKVWSVARKIAVSEKDAEDIAQEVFLQVFKSLSSFREESSFSTWIYRITMNKALDWKRRQQKSELQAVSDKMESLGDVIQLIPEEQLIKQSEKEMIDKTIKKLPEKYQHVLTLYYYQECSHQEISNQLGIAIKTVETRLYRARGLMKEQLKKEGIG